MIIKNIKQYLLKYCFIKKNNMKEKKVFFYKDFYNICFFLLNKYNVVFLKNFLNNKKEKQLFYIKALMQYKYFCKKFNKRFERFRYFKKFINNFFNKKA